MLYQMEVKKHIKSFLILFITLIMLMIMGFYKFQGFASTSGMNELLDSMPKIVKTVFGMGDYDFNTPEAMFATMWNYFIIILLSYCAYLGSSVTSKYREVIMDYTYPCSRVSIFLKRFLANLTVIIILEVLISLTMIPILKYNSISDQTLLFIASYQLIGGSLFVYGIGLLVGNLKYYFKITSMISLLIVLLFYIISIATSMVEVEILKYLSPISGLMNSSIVNNNYEIIYLIINVLLFIVFSFLSLLFFKKRDL